MRCGFCGYTDGLCYTSNPPQVRCAITGEYKYYGGECDALLEGKLSDVMAQIETSCLICGEGIPCDSHHISNRICDKCKAAVMYVRNNLERDSCTPILD